MQLLALYSARIESRYQRVPYDYNYLLKYEFDPIDHRELGIELYHLSDAIDDLQSKEPPLDHILLSCSKWLDHLYFKWYWYSYSVTNCDWKAIVSIGYLQIHYVDDMIQLSTLDFD